MEVVAQHHDPTDRHRRNRLRCLVEPQPIAARKKRLSPDRLSYGKHTFRISGCGMVAFPELNGWMHRVSGMGRRVSLTGRWLPQFDLVPLGIDDPAELAV